MLICDRCGSKETGKRPTQLIESGDVGGIFSAYEIELDGIDLCYDCTVRLEEAITDTIAAFIKKP